MKRLALETLLAWKDSTHRVPLLIRGARQVGKTWLVRECGRQFEGFLEINLESQVEYHQVFREFFGKPQELCNTLGLLSGTKIAPGKTLLFLDEIQYCKEALLALRYLKEQLPALHVITAGSLLEFTIRELSFPVGRIEFLHLFPLNFTEFLLANDRADLLDAIHAAGPRHPLPTAVQAVLLEQVAIYCLVGGMPEVVHAYAETREWIPCQTIQQRLVATFREDF